MDVVVWLIGLVNVALFTLVFVPVAQRLLGVRFGLGRLAVAAFLILAILPALTRSILGPLPLDGTAGIVPVWFLVLAVLIAILIGLVFLVVAEALVPTGSLPRVRHLRRDVGGRVTRTRRYLQILRIALRHGLGPYLRGRRRPGTENPAEQAALAVSLRLALDEAGVTFVKLGQLLSTRTDVIPAVVADEFSRLQDQVSPADWVQVERLLSAELGRPPDDVFAQFDRIPLAAASIAQVYGARLSDGERVVVKVQRPRIRPIVEGDLDIIARIANTLERNTAWGRAIGARALAAGFAQSIREELDFGVEAANMTAIAAGESAAKGEIVIPLPRLNYSTGLVLTMQRLDGISLGGAADAIRERRLDTDALADRLLTCLLRQILLDGGVPRRPASRQCLPADRRPVGPVGLRVGGSTRSSAARGHAALPAGYRPPRPAGCNRRPAGDRRPTGAGRPPATGASRRPVHGASPRAGVPGQHGDVH